MIRCFEAADEDAVVRLFLASTIPGQDFLPEEHWLAMEPKLRTQILPHADTWLVEAEGEVVAFIVTVGNHIEGLFTDPDHQGRGHGKRLVEHVLERLDGVRVELYEANERAVGVYRARGFVDHERREGDLPGLPKLIMRPGEDLTGPE